MHATETTTKDIQIVHNCHCHKELEFMLIIRRRFDDHNSLNETI